jgi:hypothetical protein
MLAKVYSGAVVGLEGELIEVEVDLLPGLPAVNVVGLLYPKGQALILPTNPKF